MDVRCLLLCSVHLVRAIPLNFISITIGLNTTGYAASQVEPVLEVGLQEMSMQYPLLFGNYSWTTRTSVNELSCSVAGKEQAIRILASLYEQDLLDGERKQTVIFAPLPCPMSFNPIADFAREVGALVATCAVSDVALVSKARFPTVLSFSRVDISSFHGAVLTLLRYYKWESISVINDDLSGQGSASMSKEMCRGTLALLKRAVSEVDFLEITTDSTTQDWNVSLKNASEHSRIILCCTLPQQLRGLMIAATDSGMSSGDYVFLSFFNLVNWMTGTASDRKVRSALPSLLIIRVPVTDTSKLVHLTDLLEAKQRSRQIDGRTAGGYTSSNILTMVMDCVEMVEVIAQVLNDSLDGRETPLAGDDLARRFFNHQFSVSTTGASLSMTSRGARRTWLEILQYDITSDDFQTVLIFDSTTSTLNSSTNWKVSWKKNTPPPDRVPCMIIEQCQDDEARVRYRTIVASCMAAGVVAIILIAFLFITIRRHSGNEWWLLTKSDLSTTEDLLVQYMEI